MSAATREMLPISSSLLSTLIQSSIWRPKLRFAGLRIEIRCFQLEMCTAAYFWSSSGVLLFALLTNTRVVRYHWLIGISSRRCVACSYTSFFKFLGWTASDRPQTFCFVHAGSPEGCQTSGVPSRLCSYWICHSTD